MVRQKPVVRWDRLRRIGRRKWPKRGPDKRETAIEDETIMNHPRQSSQTDFYRQFSVLLWITFGLMMLGSIGHADEPTPSGPRRPAASPSKDWKIIRGPDGPVSESSGLVPASGGGFWTHNDSGDGPWLYHIGSDATVLHALRLKVTRPKDWEDIAAVVIDGERWLVLADTGDNLHQREKVQLLFLREPNVENLPRGEPILDPDASIDDEAVITVDRRVTLQYEDGPRDCEAIAVDPTTKRIILVTKTKLPWCGLYTAPLPDLTVRVDGTTPAPVSTVIASRVRHLTIPMATGMSIHPRTGDVLISSYFHLFHYPPMGHLHQTLAQNPAVSRMPRLGQIEAVCFGSAGRVWVSSEGQPLQLAVRDLIQQRSE